MTPDLGAETRVNDAFDNVDNAVTATARPDLAEPPDDDWWPGLHDCGGKLLVRVFALDTDGSFLHCEKCGARLDVPTPIDKLRAAALLHPNSPISQPVLEQMEALRVAINGS